MDTKLVYKGYLKGAYFDNINNDFSIIFGKDGENLLLNLQFDSTKPNITDHYSMNISKMEDDIITSKFIYLPKKVQEVSIDFNVLTKVGDIDYFDVNGIFAINHNNVNIYLQDLMPSNLYQLQHFLQLEDEVKQEYLDELYRENYDIIDYNVTNEPLSIEDQMDILQQVDTNSLNEKLKENNDSLSER